MRIIEEIKQFEAIVTERIAKAQTVNQDSVEAESIIIPDLKTLPVVIGETGAQLGEYDEVTVSLDNPNKTETAVLCNFDKTEPVVVPAGHCDLNEIEFPGLCIVKETELAVFYDVNEGGGIELGENFVPNVYVMNNNRPTHESSDIEHENELDFDSDDNNSDTDYVPEGGESSNTLNITAEGVDSECSYPGSRLKRKVKKPTKLSQKGNK